jgi:hypothetical protein
MVSRHMSDRNGSSLTDVPDLRQQPVSILAKMIDGHFFGSPLQPKSFISGKESGVVNGKRGNVIRW